MKTVLVIAAFAAVTATPMTYAQFGSGVVYDPTQATHAVVQIKNEERSIANEIQQIEQGQKIFTNTVKLADNAIATYNLAHQNPRETQRRIEEYAVECSIQKVYGSEMT